MMRSAKPSPLHVFWRVNLVLWLLCGAAIAFNILVRHRGYPYNWPFLRFNHFIDFYDFRMRFKHYHHLDFFSAPGMTVFSYPPPVGILYELFYVPRTGAHSIFTVLTTLPCVYLAWMLYRALRTRGITPLLAFLFTASACLLSFPFWFDYMLGNVEICIFLMLAAAMIAFLRGRLYLAAAIIGIAGSMKLFPFILLGLFLSRREYRHAAFGILAAAVLYPVSVWLECPSFSLAREGMRKGAQAMSNALILQWHQAETSFDHSLFGIFKQTMHLLGYSNTQPAHRLTVYMACAAVAGIVLYFWKIRTLPMMNQILLLILAGVLLPPMSHDYTLLHLYIPWALLVLTAVEANAERRTVPGLYAAMLCFAILFSPESEVILWGAAVAGQIKAVTLIILWYIGMKYPFQLPRNIRVAETGQVAQPAAAA